MFGVAAAAFLLLLVVFLLIARPFVATRAPGDDEGSQALEDRGRLLAQIRDLDMEFATGKLQEDEYRALRSARVAEAEQVEQVLADAAGADDREPPSDTAVADDAAEAGSNGPLDDELEGAIAARKRAMRVSACPDCGAAHDPDDRYCRACGTTLEKAETR